MIKGSVIPELFALKNLFYTTVLIRLLDDDGNESGYGTGFFFHLMELDEHDETIRTTLLITNEHVVRDSLKAKITLHLGPVIDDIPTGGTYELVVDPFESSFVKHPGGLDLCAMDFDPCLQQVRKNTGKTVHYQAFSEQHFIFPDQLRKIFPASDVLMVGYPIGLCDEVNNLPIVRKGITASHPFYDFNGTSSGAVDIASYHGSSGSPIMLYSQGEPNWSGVSQPSFHLLGILYNGEYETTEGVLRNKPIPLKKEIIPVIEVFIHLGYYVKATEILAFEPFFKTGK